jgi:hypothetical protein
MNELKMSNKKVSLDQLTSIIVYFCTFLVIILSILGLFHILPIELTNSIAIPMLGIITLINGLKTYKTNKRAGIISLVSAIIILVCSIFIFLCKLRTF